MFLSKIQWIALSGSVIFIFIILWQVRQKKIKEAYSLLWLLIGIGMVVLSLWSNCLRAISGWIGIFYPPATLFLLLLCGIILILFQYNLIMSRNQERISRLSQEIALLRRELEELKKDKKHD